MILLIDPVCYGNMHEIANGGMVKLVSEAFAEKVCYIAEKENSNIIEHLLPDIDAVYGKINRFDKQRDPDNDRNYWYYFTMIEWEIIMHRPSKLFILCAYRPCIRAMIDLAFFHRNIEICIVLHGMVEKGFGRQGEYRKLLQASMKRNNIRFLSYSPYCTADFWGIKKGKIININHPYIHKIERDANEREGAPITIGLIGGCANKKSKYIINKIAKRCSNYEYSFWVASRFALEFGGLPQTKIYRGGFGREEIIKRMEKIDYLLLPYGKGEYEVSASGVLWDGITNGVPCLMLDSSYFELFRSYDIGEHFDSLDTMLDGIEKIIKNRERKQYLMCINGLLEKNISNLKNAYMEVEV